MSDGKKETRETDGAQEASAASESDAKTPGPEDTIEDMEKRGLKGEETVVIGAEKGDARGLTEKEFVDRMEVGLCILYWTRRKNVGGTAGARYKRGTNTTFR